MADHDHPPTDLDDRADRFMALYTTNHRHVYLYVRSLVPNHADVDDILQQTNMVLWRKFDEFQPGTSFRAWACRIAWFEIHNHRNRSGKGGLRFSDEFLDDVADAVQQHSDTFDARAEALRHCMDKLNDRDRDLIQRRYEDDATGESVAAAVGRSVRAVYKAVSRIRKLLADCINDTLKREGVE